MASSSVSQESLDHDDYEISQRRMRVRTLRPRTAPHKSESIETTDDKDEAGEEEDMFDSLTGSGHVTFAPGSSVPLVEHDSPTRMMARGKDKRLRPNHVHLHKGKAAKDKRKLREKRRSTGVVHLQNAGSTGDSLDEDVETELTRRNTSYNEVIDADNPQTPEEERKSFAVRRVRNKSPSDLDADLEDNQDYDSTVSQSETNLTTVGQSMVTPPTAQQTPPTSDVNKPTQLPPPVSVRPSVLGSVVSCSVPTAWNALAQPIRAAPAPVPPTHHAPTNGGIEGAGRGGGARDHHHHHYHHHHRHQEVVDTKLLARNVDLERQLDLEREQNRRLQETLDERERRISQLEKQISQLNKDVVDVSKERDNIHQENLVLLKAIRLSH